MKKEIFYYLILIFVIAGLMLLEINVPDSERVNISKVIDVDRFEKLDIDLACNIYVSIGEEQKVVLEGPEQYLNHIEAHLENGILRLSEKSAGMFGGIFNVNHKSAKEVNIYLQLTAADQLISPKKGNLITNEAALLNELKSQQQFSFDHQLLSLLKMLGSQMGFIHRGLL
jgi:hypothetical protein